ncbi:MAG: hypothetical protein ACI932_002381 [Paracoccaceae bacterium]|jgi:hypothetical protein
MKLILSVFLSLWTMTAMAFAADFGIKFGEVKDYRLTPVASFRGM